MQLFTTPGQIDSRDVVYSAGVECGAFRRNLLQIMQFPTVTDWRLQFPRATYRQALRMFIVWRHSTVNYDLRGVCGEIIEINGGGGWGERAAPLTEHTHLAKFFNATVARRSIKTVI